MPILVDQGTWNKQNCYNKSYYTNKDAVEKVIRYITRTRYNENKANELIKVGAAGINCLSTINEMIRHIEYVQEIYQIKRRGGRRIVHEVYSFSEQEFRELNNDYGYIDMIAREISYYYYCMGHQVVYAIHYSQHKKVHIHFAINTINFYTGKKFHSNTHDFQLRKKYFDDVYIKTCYQAKNYGKNTYGKICPIEFFY